MRDIKHLWTCSVWNASQNLSFPSHPPVLTLHNFTWHYTSGSRSRPRADYGKPQFWHLWFLPSATLVICKHVRRCPSQEACTLPGSIQRTRRITADSSSILEHKRRKTVVTKICLLTQIWKMLEGKKIVSGCRTAGISTGLEIVFIVRW